MIYVIYGVNIVMHLSTYIYFSINNNNCLIISIILLLISCFIAYNAGLFIRC